MTEIDVLKIKEIAINLAKSVEGFEKRDFLAAIHLGKEPRIKVLRGFRGIGKTTALLQMMSGVENRRAIYFSMDHPYVEKFRIYDLGKEFVKVGYTTLLIDEVHYCTNWEKDTKALYDEFPGIDIVVSGSAPLAFTEERRYEIIEVEPMSLREFSSLKGKKIPATESWSNIDDTLSFLAFNNWLYEYFDEYMTGGAFPIYFTYKDKTLSALYSSIRKSIREDAPFFNRVDGEMLRGMERMLALVASSPPGEFSVNSMSKHLELTKYKTYEIVRLLEAMKILRIVVPFGRGAKLVRGEPKLLFYHPALRTAVCDAVGIKPDKGALREDLAVFSFKQRGWHVFTIKGMKKSPDYIIEKGERRIVIEIGGPGKKRTQLRDFKFETIVLTERQLIPLAFY